MNVSWGRYRGYEGAYYYGSRKFHLPEDATAEEKILDVVTGTEGGAPDAVNGYDRCIISAGYIQFCEIYFGTSDLLGYIAERGGSLDPLKEILDLSGASFRSDRGRWRFFQGKEVISAAEKRKLFLFRSDGKIGTWDYESKRREKMWISAISECLRSKEAEKLQIEFTVPRLRRFASSSARRILWDGSETGLAEATRAGFLSYAANLPSVASKHLGFAVSNSKEKKWSHSWVCDVFRELTFGPRIAIYPGRYRKIKPRLEQNYGITLPDLEELRKRHHYLGLDLTEVQEILLRKGYDLGPAGADGRFGPKTLAAVKLFQKRNLLKQDGIIGTKTTAALRK